MLKSCSFIQAPWTFIISVFQTVIYKWSDKQNIGNIVVISNIQMNYDLLLQLRDTQQLLKIMFAKWEMEMASDKYWYWPEWLLLLKINKTYSSTYLDSLMRNKIDRIIYSIASRQMEGLRQVLGLKMLSLWTQERIFWALIELAIHYGLSVDS